MGGTAFSPGVAIPPAGAWGYVQTLEPAYDQTTHQMTGVGPKVKVEGTSYGITGSVSNGTYPTFGIFLAAGQTTNIVEVFLATGTGTATVTVTDKGVSIPSLTNLVASVSPLFIAITPFPLAQFDYIGLTVINSNCTNLTVTIFRQDIF